MSNVIDDRAGHGGNLGSKRMHRDQGDGSFTVDQSGLLYVWDTNTLSWIRAVGDSSGRLVTSHGKTILYATIAQGGAGTTTLVSADTTKKIKVVSFSFTLSATGTAKFSDGTVDLSGAYDIQQYGGIATSSDPSAPLMETAAVNRPLQIITATGAAKGQLAYYLEA